LQLVTRAKDKPVQQVLRVRQVVMAKTVLMVWMPLCSRLVLLALTVNLEILELAAQLALQEQQVVL
jgi:hypothetical protein